MKLIVRMLAAAVLLATAPAVMQAHFRALEPASWIVENQLGDPQKAAPAAGTNADWGTPTNAVTQAVGRQQDARESAGDGLPSARLLSASRWR